MRIINVYLDPPTARALDVVDFRSSFFGWLHRFHENLTIPEYSGRAIVGWVGVGMLILSLTGIWLWWPVTGSVRRGFRWKRQPSFNANLHHQMGFWVLIPLAMLSFTGVWISFPQAFGRFEASAPKASPPPRCSRSARADPNRPKARCARTRPVFGSWSRARWPRSLTPC